MGGPELEGLVIALEAKCPDSRVPEQGVDHAVGDKLGSATAGLEHGKWGAILDAEAPGAMIDADGGAGGTVGRTVGVIAECDVLTILFVLLVAPSDGEVADNSLIDFGVGETPLALVKENEVRAGHRAQRLARPVGDAHKLVTCGLAPFSGA